MKLSEELGRINEFEDSAVELLASSMYLSKCLSRLSSAFLGTRSVTVGDGVHVLTEMQYNALQILLDRKDVTTVQTELAERLLINNSSAGTLIDTLEARSWVARKAKDRRANYIDITEEGAALLSDLQPSFDKMCETLLEGFSNEERVLFLTFMSRYRDRAKSLAPELLDG